MPDWILSVGTAAEASEIVVLVNQAYRGIGEGVGKEGSARGWTDEQGLVEGPRTSMGEILERMSTGKFLCAREVPDGPLLGGVWFEPRAEEAYIGMLSVAPARQSQGLGKVLMRECENLAREAGIPVLELTVLAPRLELQAWYERQGYRKTGQSLPFPHGGPLELVVFQKRT